MPIIIKTNNIININKTKILSLLPVAGKTNKTIIIIT
jgi:hypothetical protein